MSPRRSSQLPSSVAAAIAKARGCAHRFCVAVHSHAHRTPVPCSRTALSSRVRCDIACVVCAVWQLERSTSQGTGLLLNMCISYGGRGDVVRSCRALCSSVQEGNLAVDDITEDAIAKGLETAGMPDPDLLIRTSGEYRLSNFLLFQLAYAELVFIDKFWPELTKDDFLGVLGAFSSRQRRFGS